MTFDPEKNDQIELPAKIATISLTVTAKVRRGEKADFKPRTINLAPQWKIPGGFYTGHVFHGDEHLGQAMILSLPFNERIQGLEAYIAGFSGDLYDEEVTITNMQQIDRKAMEVLIESALLLTPLPIRRPNND